MNFWKHIKYLILDESSMLSRAFFATFEQNICIAKGFDGNDGAGLPFGGVNTAPLYYLVNIGIDTLKEQNGRRLYEQFTIVVLLDQQVQVTDSKWLAFLRHLRYGKVKEADMEMLKRLVLTSKDCPPTDFQNMAWKDHCKDTKQKLFICPAFDTINECRLSLAEHYAMVTKQDRKQGGRQTKNGLPNKVEIALGMKVIVTTNVDTDLDVTNGSRGEIVGIVLDPKEDQSGSSAVVTLEYPPAYILVKLPKT
ncbi:hypothetical protein K439DRAFT_1400224 [Ramaria rubella]|nr:hypothetical protein K439DRAFT_1400224 [Ramaria rubella]